ncbi:hypothetical protein [Lysinibacillus sphaericus]|uniref:hypothetical protein n=1 Tax=Lysinibacillus sphaericus TaxID=1421 RepID=UPI003D74DFDA
MFCIAYRKIRVKDKGGFLKGIIIHEECIENQGFCLYQEEKQVIHFKYYKKINSRFETGFLETTIANSIRYADVFIITDKNLMMICGSRYCINALQNFSEFRKLFYIEKMPLDINDCLKAYSFMKPEVKQISLENVKAFEISLSKITMEFKNSLDSFKLLNNKKLNITEALIKVNISSIFFDLLIDLKDGEIFFDNVDYILREFSEIKNFGMLILEE